MESEVLDFSQAELEEAFHDDLSVDISGIQEAGTSRMDISGAEVDTMNMSFVTQNSPTIVTPKPTVNPYLKWPPRSDQQQTNSQRPEGVEETKEELVTLSRTGRVEETKEEMAPLEIPGPPTPAGSKWQHFTRIDVILQVSPIGDSATASSRAVSEMLLGVFNGTKTKFEVFPWHITSTNRIHIQSSRHVPTHKDKLLEFCYDLYLPAKNDGGRSYFKLWVGTDKDFKTYKEEAKPWLTQKGWSIFESVLQVEKTATLGWLYGSHGDTNRSVLARAILKTTGVQVGLKYRAISLPNDRVKGKLTPTAPKTPIRAIHLEIDSESSTYEQDLGKIRAVYATGASSFPLNLEFRLVPMATGLVDPKSGPKLQALRKSQEKFVSKLKNFTSPDIATLDKEIDKGLTLQESILDLRPKDTSRSDRLFKGVDHHFANWNLVTFTCLQKDGDEALATINSLLPRLLLKAATPAMKFHLPTCFSANAQFAAERVQWNTETGDLQSHDDQAIEAIIEMDLGSDEESVSSSKKSVSFSTKSVKSASKSTVGSDISSFGSKTFKRLIAKPTPDEDDDQISVASAASEATTIASNRSKADSRTSSLSRDTSGGGVTRILENLVETINSQGAEAGKKDEEIRKQLVVITTQLAESKREAKERKEIDRAEKEDIQRQLDRYTAFMQGSSQRSTHQPTDAAAHGDSYTPTERQPHGSDAAMTDPGNGSGVGDSL